MTKSFDANAKFMLSSTLYNVTIMTEGFKVLRKQFYAGNITGAVNQGEEFGTVFRVVESIADSEDHLFRMKG